MTADQIQSLQPALAALLAMFRPCFKRVASFGHWERYIVGLITDLKRKSIEPIALAANTPLGEMLQVAFAWWHVEKWFARAKQEAGFGAFEVRTYTGMIRHWLSSRMAMYFLATVLWEPDRHAPAHLAECAQYYQERNAASYRSRRRRGRRKREKVALPY